MVGCGAFAHRYHVPAILADDSLSIGAIFDPKASDETRALAQRYRAPLVDRFEELPQPRGLAFAIVTTPHTMHAGHVDAVLDRKLNVLVDKPFVMKAADARRLAARADTQQPRQRRRLQPAFRPRVPARARDPARGRHRRGALRPDRAARLRASWMVPRTRARRRRSLHRPREPYGGPAAVAARSRADAPAQPASRELAHAQRPRRLHRAPVRRAANAR